MDAGGAGLYGGMHSFPRPLLTAYQEAVADEQLGAELESALASLNDSGIFEVGGEQYKRVPRGYDPDHPRANLLRYKGLHARSPKIEPATLVSPNLVETCFEYCHRMAPLHRWLVEVSQKV